MDAPDVRRRSPRPGSAFARAFRMAVAAEVLVLALGAVIVTGPVSGGSPASHGQGGAPGGAPGGAAASTDAPGARRSATATPRPPAALPTDSPRAAEPAALATPGSPASQATPQPTRPPMLVPASSPGSVARPPAPRPGGGAPACAYLDEPVEHDDYDDWALTLLDTIYRLPSSYAPTDLVDSSAAGLNGGHPVRAFVIADLAEMASAARAAGVPVEIVSGYRSFATQRATFRRWVRIDGREKALRTSARAGHSEHQLGTAIDVRSLGGRDPWDLEDWASTPAGGWIAANSWRYGFVVSYPRAAVGRSCYEYEPWHLRYMGRERAAAIVASGLTLREFLWRLQ